MILTAGRYGHNHARFVETGVTHESLPRRTFEQIDIIQDGAKMGANN